MRQFKWVGGVLAMLAMLATLGGPTSAQEGKDKGKEDKARKIPAGNPGIRALANSLTLAAIGKEQKLPEALIAAARLIVTVKVEGEGKEKGTDTLAVAKKWLDEAEA